MVRYLQSQELHSFGCQRVQFVPELQVLHRLPLLDFSVHLHLSSKLRAGDANKKKNTRHGVRERGTQGRAACVSSIYVDNVACCFLGAGGMHAHQARKND